MLLLWTPGANLPDVGLARKIPFIDKLVHFIIFTVLAFLLSGRMQLEKKRSVLFSNILIVVLITFSYSAILETGQLWVVGRSFNIADLLVNLTGCIAGSFFYKSLA